MELQNETSRIRGSSDNLVYIDEACFETEPEVWNTYKVSVGDRYDDGHGKHEWIHITTNCSDKEIGEAYRKSSEIIGHCVFENICKDYGEHTVKSEVVTRLFECGVNLDPFERYSNEDQMTLWMDAEGLVKLVMEMTKISLTSLEYTIVQDDVDELFINSIGYGIFE